MLWACSRDSQSLEVLMLVDNIIHYLKIYTSVLGILKFEILLVAFFILSAILGDGGGKEGWGGVGLECFMLVDIIEGLVNRGWIIC